MENTKSCRLCEIVQPKENFNKSIGVKDGLANECKQCRHNHRASLKFERQEDGTKYCNTCKINKDVLNFSGNCKNSDGLESSCKPCRVEYVLTRASTFDGFLKTLFNDLKRNAKTRNIQINITLQDIINKYNEQAGLCNLTLYKMTYCRLNINNITTHIKNYFNISVDRIDSAKPYTKDNIQLVCSIINLLKGNMKECDFIDRMKTIAHHSGFEQNKVQKSIKDLSEFKDIKHLIDS